MPLKLLAVGISGSPSSRSRSRTLLEQALRNLKSQGASTELVDLNALPADALLGRRTAHEVERALAHVAGAHIVLASTPVYRATYSGLLKVFFDLFGQRALAGKVGVAIATGGAPGHQLVIEHGLRPLFASVGATVVPTGVYAVDDAFPGGVPNDSVLDRLAQATSESIAFAQAHYARTDLPIESVPVVERAVPLPHPPSDETLRSRPPQVDHIP
jgi:FMN reductase